MESTHSWEDFLLNNGEIPYIKQDTVRMIHVKNINRMYQEEIVFLLYSSFDALEIFLTSDSSALVVLKTFPDEFDDTLLEILELVRLDLNTSLKLLVGNVHLVNNTLYDAFKYEHNLLTYLDSDFEYLDTIYINNVLSQSKELKTLYPLAYKTIKEDLEVQNMIISLWENDGNIVQSASELYIHRNTIIYRMNKYQKITGLNLKKSNGLLISYLLARRLLCKQ